MFAPSFVRLFGSMFARRPGSRRPVRVGLRLESLEAREVPSTTGTDPDDSPLAPPTNPPAATTDTPPAPSEQATPAAPPPTSEDDAPSEDGPPSAPPNGSSAGVVNLTTLAELMAAVAALQAEYAAAEAAAASQPPESGPELPDPDPAAPIENGSPPPSDPPPTTGSGSPDYTSISSAPIPTGPVGPDGTPVPAPQIDMQRLRTMLLAERNVLLGMRGTVIRMELFLRNFQAIRRQLELAQMQDARNNPDHDPEAWRIFRAAADLAYMRVVQDYVYAVQDHQLRYMVFNILVKVYGPGIGGVPMPGQLDMSLVEGFIPTPRPTP